MNCLITDADFRRKRKGYLYVACLTFALLVSVISGKPTGEETNYDDDLDASDFEDDLIWKNVKPTTSAPKIHHVVSYKEDYVNEDYDPTKEIVASSAEDSAALLRHYQQLQRSAVENNKTKEYRHIKPEKVYFDYYPIEDLKLDGVDPKDMDDMKFEVVSLVEDDDDAKHKKYHHHHHKKHHSKHHSEKRSKRDVSESEKHHGKASTPNKILKREIDPYDGIFEKYPSASASVNQYSSNPSPSKSHEIRRRQYYSYQTVNTPSRNYHLSPPVPSGFNGFIKYPIRGTYYNPLSPPGSLGPFGTKINTGNNDDISFSNRIGDDDEDRVVWDVSYPNQPSRNVNNNRRPSGNNRPATRRPAPPLIHGFGDDEPVTTRRPAPAEQTTTRRSPNNQAAPTRRPSSNRFPPNSNNNNFQSPAQTSRPPTRPQPTQPQLSQCVWAIVSCCSRNKLDIRYQCFEQMGCSGAFWDLNPCADNIQDIALNAADNYFD